MAVDLKVSEGTLLRRLHGGCSGESRVAPSSQLDEPSEELVFSILRRKVIQRGVCSSVPALMDAIRGFLDGCDSRKRPLAWVTTPEQV